MWVVYLIQHDETRDLYFGVTNDLRRRLEEHNRGEQTATRRTSGRWLIIYAEAYRSRADALERERMLKHHGSSKQKLMGRISRSLLGD